MEYVLNGVCCEKITQSFPKQSYSVFILNPTYSLLWPTYYPFNPTACSDLEGTWHYPGDGFFAIGGRTLGFVSCLRRDTELSQKQSSWNKQSSTGLGFY